MVRWDADFQWLDGEQRPRLGLFFLNNTNPISSASELPPWFENLLPERGSPLRSRLCTKHSLRDGQSYDLLRAVGGDVIGAAQFVALGNETNDDNSPPDNAASDSAMEHMSSLTGMQLKLSMSMVNKRLAVGARGRNSEWIVKFPGAEHPELPCVEQITMKWAQCIDLDVPRFKVVDVDGLVGLPANWTDATSAFAVERFDRRPDGTRVHQEDFCQALGIPSAKKYGDHRDALVSYDKALQLVLDTCGTDQVREMARRLGFMIASGNTDAHLKNWSFLWGDRTRPVLTPNYDLVATISWSEKYGWDQKGGPKLALKLGGETLFQNVDGSCVAQLAKVTSTVDIVAEIRDVISAAKKEWKSLREEAPKRMRLAVDHHMQHVPLLG